MELCEPIACVLWIYSEHFFAVLPRERYLIIVSKCECASMTVTGKWKVSLKDTFYWVTNSLWNHCQLIKWILQLTIVSIFWQFRNYKWFRYYLTYLNIDLTAIVKTIIWMKSQYWRKITQYKRCLSAYNFVYYRVCKITVGNLPEVMIVIIKERFSYSGNFKDDVDLMSNIYSSYSFHLGSTYLRRLG